MLLTFYYDLTTMLLACCQDLKRMLVRFHTTQCEWRPPKLQSVVHQKCSPSKLMMHGASKSSPRGQLIKRMWSQSNDDARTCVRPKTPMNLSCISRLLPPTRGKLGTTDVLDFNKILLGCY